MESIKVEAAGPVEDNPPSSIILDGLFTTPSTGSNSSIINDQLVSVTPGTANQKGAIWSIDDIKMDLTKDFTATMYLYFGNNGNNAADGMAFVMHNDSRGVNAIAKSGASLGVWADEGYNGSKTSGIQKVLLLSLIPIKMMVILAILILMLTMTMLHGGIQGKPILI